MAEPLDVERLPRRVAHAVHALLTAARETNQTCYAREVVVYDEEALDASQTGDALQRARDGWGLAVNAGRLWVATNRAADLRVAFETRYLHDTAREGEVE